MERKPNRGERRSGHASLGRLPRSLPQFLSSLPQFPVSEASGNWAGDEGARNRRCEGEGEERG